MKKYLPTNSELRIAIFTTIVAIIIIFVGGHILRWGMWSLGGGCGMQGCKMNSMQTMNMGDKMHKMPDGTMMMNHDADMMNMTMNDMVKMVDGKTGKDLEKEFIVGMIPHHQGAVEMSKKLLTDKTISPEIKKFAEQIISAQESEIKLMNEWLKKY